MTQLSLFNIQIFKYMGACCSPVYPRELTEAYDWLEKYKASRKEAELHQVRGEAAGGGGREMEEAGGREGDAVRGKQAGGLLQRL